MSKETLHNTGCFIKPTEFSEFWITVSEQLGSSRLNVNRKATSIRHFLSPQNNHQDFLKDLVTDSYKLSSCYHLNAPINLNTVLDLLGETAYQLKGSNNDDLLDIELLEEICWLISERYGVHITMPERQYKTADKTTSNRTQTITSLPLCRIRRSNQKL